MLANDNILCFHFLSKNLPTQDLPLSQLKLWAFIGHVQGSADVMWKEQVSFFYS